MIRLTHEHIAMLVENPAAFPHMILGAPLRMFRVYRNAVPMTETAHLFCLYREMQPLSEVFAVNLRFRGFQMADLVEEWEQPTTDDHLLMLSHR